MTGVASSAEHPALEALRFYQLGVGAQGRLPLYHRLLGAMLDDVAAGGVCAELLADPGPDPIDDAVPLRLLGAVHRLVLMGRAPELAAFYPSVGGAYEPEGAADPAPIFLATIEANRDDVAAGLARSVQTNEVGRCNALLIGFLAVADTTRVPLRILEVGASAGLNLRWDRYRYEGGAEGTAFGPVGSPVRLGGVFGESGPPLDRLAVVVERRGCDAAPLDPGSPDDVLTLRSFIWPEQLDRLSRFDAALQVARGVPAPVDKGDAGDWLREQLSTDAGQPGMATVVFHSIVWQYLGAGTRGRVMAALYSAGRSATQDAPVAWLRMEPSEVGARDTEVRLTQWPGGNERIVARAGYHGQRVQALAVGAP
ncbi:MAG: DUF2332 domain-containing protein [Acidimicrobiales bacterium]